MTERSTLLDVYRDHFCTLHFEQACLALLSVLAAYQHQLIEHDPVRARILGRRLACGLKECFKIVQQRGEKVKLLIVAQDIVEDEFASQWLEPLLSLTRSSATSSSPLNTRVPLLFAANRKRLAKACHIKGKASAVIVLSAHGCEEEARAILQALTAAQEQWCMKGCDVQSFPTIERERSIQQQLLNQSLQKQRDIRESLNRQKEKKQREAELQTQNKLAAIRERKAREHLAAVASQKQQVKLDIVTSRKPAKEKKAPKVNSKHQSSNYLASPFTDNAIAKPKITPDENSTLKNTTSLSTEGSRKNKSKKQGSTEEQRNKAQSNSAVNSIQSTKTTQRTRKR